VKNFAAKDRVPDVLDSCRGAPDRAGLSVSLRDFLPNSATSRHRSRAPQGTNSGSADDLAQMPSQNIQQGKSELPKGSLFDLNQSGLAKNEDTFYTELIYWLRSTG
jgi:hypothetical protein